MEVVGLVASIGTLLGTAQTVMQYIQCVRHASEEQDNFFNEVKTTHGLLTSLSCRLMVLESKHAKSETAWSRSLHTIAITQDAFEELNKSLIVVMKEIQPGDSKKARMSNRLGWIVRKDTCEEALHRMQRIKSDLIAALSSDTLTVAEQISDGIDEVKEGLLEIQTMLQGFNKNVEDLTFAVKNTAMFKWLGAPEVQHKHDRLRRQHQEATGNWFLETDYFREWKEDAGKLLWVTGIRRSSS